MKQVFLTFIPTIILISLFTGKINTSPNLSIDQKRSIDAYLQKIRTCLPKNNDSSVPEDENSQKNHLLSPIAKQAIRETIREFINQYIKI